MSDLARVETSRVDATQVVRVTGELDLSNAHAVVGAVGHGVPEHVTLLVLDLAGTTYLDSAAIASLFRLAQRLRDHRQELRLVVPREAPTRAVVELTRLSQVVTVDESAADLPQASQAYAALPPLDAVVSRRRGEGSGEGLRRDGGSVPGDR